MNRTQIRSLLLLLFPLLTFTFTVHVAAENQLVNVVTDELSAEFIRFNGDDAQLTICKTNLVPCLNRAARRVSLRLQLQNSDVFCLNPKLLMRYEGCRLQLWFSGQSESVCLQQSHMMASAEGLADDLNPLRRSSSMVLPPNMPELRVVLLGNSWSQRSWVGNFILEKNEFNTEEEPDHCQRVRGKLKEKRIVLINTPDLLHPNISDDKLTEHVRNCVRLSDPGPHVFLLVLQPENFSEEQKLRLCRVLGLFNDRSFDHSLVLISTSREDGSGVRQKYMQRQPLKDLKKMCKYRHLIQETFKLPELLTRFGQIVKEKNGAHLTCDVFKHEAADFISSQGSESGHIIPDLNLVLCGRRGAEKTSAAEAILGRRELHSVSSECVQHQGEVCGRWVSVVELPGLYGKPQEEVMEESLRCISLCDPEGVHAFILVLPVDPLTDEDKRELETIQKTFGSRVNDFTMILFTVESDPAASDASNFVNKNRDIQELCQSCGGRPVVLNINDKKQISEMLDTVRKMRAEGPRRFTKDMFTKAQMENVSRLQAELQNVKQKSEEREPLRLVLIGKTGSGKSATANTIIGKRYFKPRITPKPASTCCEEAAGEIDGRPVVVVTTPALFDTTLSDDEIQRELHKCIGLLSPGPHAFLLVMQIGNFTQEERQSVDLIKRAFGEGSAEFIVVVFTRGDALEDQSLESYVEGCDDFVKQLLHDCGWRYQVFNNKDDTKRAQVRELVAKIEAMVRRNGGGCYSAERFEWTKTAMQRQVEQQHEELQQMKMKMEAEISGMKQELEHMKRKQPEKKDKCCVA